MGTSSEESELFRSSKNVGPELPNGETLEREAVRHTNSPCTMVGSRSFSWKPVADNNETNLRLKYFNVSESRNPSRDGWGNPVETSRGKQMSRTQRSQISLSLSPRREKMRKNLTIRPCTVGYDNEYKHCSHVSLLGEKLSEMSFASPAQGLQPKISARDHIPKRNILPKFSFKRRAPSLGRPLKKEDGRYKPTSVIKIDLQIPSEEPVKQKSWKSADVFMRHLNSQKTYSVLPERHPFTSNYYEHITRIDTKLLEVVSKYNKPLWEDLVGDV